MAFRDIYKLCYGTVRKGETMKYKHIEASREARLWIGQVIAPVALAAVALLSNPTVRQWVDEKVGDFKENRRKPL